MQGGSKDTHERVKRLSGENHKTKRTARGMKRASRSRGKHRRGIRWKDEAQNAGSYVHSFGTEQVSVQMWRAGLKMEKRQKPEKADLA